MELANIFIRNVLLVHIAGKSLATTHSFWRKAYLIVKMVCILLISKKKTVRILNDFKKRNSIMLQIGTNCSRQNVSLAVSQSRPVIVG